MRRRRSSVRRFSVRHIAIASALVVALSRGALAQSGSVDEGATDLLRPTGARSVAMGLALTAAAIGGEAVWSNPALIARARREAALHLRGRSLASDPDGDATLFAILPWQQVGVIAVGLRYLDYGSQDATTSPVVVGSFSNTNIILSLSAATTFGRLAAGFTLKHLRYNLPCTGDCTQLADVSTPSGSALDVGGQYALRDSTLSIGVSVINLGPKFQVQDAPQADPLPGRANVGVLYAPIVPSWTDVRVRVTGDVVSRITSGTGLGFRLGAEAGYQERVFGRAGYMYLGPGEISTPTIGFGVATAKLHIDFAQMMKSVASATNRPTFLSLRYTF
jgi:hypothetical protein